MTADNANWWRTGIIYQIYPGSFQDSNEDGVGDSAGVIQRLPNLAELGIDAIWLSPIVTAPMADFGYNIANCADVDPLFGSVVDLDRLISAAPRNRRKNHSRSGAQSYLRSAFRFHARVP
jgi:alpha-glucosidase